MALLNVKNLNISVAVEGGEKALVKNASFCVEKGEVLGLVGPSGSGKSIMSMALSGILNDEYKITADSIELDGRHLDKVDEKGLCDIRGKEISYIFQEPMTSLNPTLTIYKQVEEPLIIHNIPFKSKADRKKAVCTGLKDAGLEPTEALLRSYPHQLSGGQRQRVMIAMAFICNPQLLIADEITTALDTDTREVIVDLLMHHREKHKTSIIFISHDTKLVSRVSDRIIYMKSGQIIGSNDDGREDEDLSMPFTRNMVYRETDRKPILKVRDLCFSYVDSGIFGQTKTKEVLKGISFDLYEGETLGIVGRSGAGKSTLVKAITGLQKPTSGTVEYDEFSGDPQMVFQDPYSSLNPAKKVGAILLESMRLGEQRDFKKGILSSFKTSEEARLRIFEMLKSVDLSSEIAYRRISELSGGQRQRVAIACALISGPSIVILDEPVSALDKQVQEQILSLLDKLKRSMGCSYIFISHDPSVVERTCDRVMVLENGKGTFTNE